MQSVFSPGSAWVKGLALKLPGVCSAETYRPSAGYFHVKSEDYPILDMTI
jgi:hypothetical protein